MLRKCGMIVALAGATWFLTTALAVAAEGTVTKIDEKGAMVRMGEKEHMAGMIPGAKVGDKVNCTMTRHTAGGLKGTAGGSTGGTTGGSAGSSTGTTGGMTGETAGTTPAMQMTCTKM
jgi:hypothetical protein